MSEHHTFTAVGITLLVLWVVSLAGFAFTAKACIRRAAHIAYMMGGIIVWAYLGWLYHALERLPMRTLGETRLWYMAFLSLLGLVMYHRWKSRLFILPSVVMSLVFLIITMVHPETLDKSQMPALDSPWFAPHVIIYMLSYAVLGTASAVAVWTLLSAKKIGAAQVALLEARARTMVTVGFPLLTTGFILGAFWAKIAWGHYWSWDPKETWAFITWGVYLAYLHLYQTKKMSVKLSLGIISAAFIVILMCWFGVTFLPTAASSVHVYSK